MEVRISERPRIPRIKPAMARPFPSILPRDRGYLTQRDTREDDRQQTSQSAQPDQSQHQDWRLRDRSCEPARKRSRSRVGLCAVWSASRSGGIVDRRVILARALDGQEPTPPFLFSRPVRSFRFPRTSPSAGVRETEVVLGEYLLARRTIQAHLEVRPPTDCWPESTDDAIAH